MKYAINGVLYRVCISIEKRYKLHLFVFTLLSLHLFIFNSVSFTDKLLASAVCLGVLIHLKKITFKFERRVDLIVFVLINAYLTFAVFGYDLFLASSMYTDNVMNLFTFMLGFIWTCYVLQSFLNVIKKATELKDRICSPSENNYWGKWLLLLTIMIALFMLWQRAYNPIVLSPDSWEYFGNSYIIGRSVLYVYINNLIMRLAPTVPAVEWIAITQIVVFSCLLSTILMYLHSRWIRFRWVIAAAIALPLIPSFGLHTIVVWADLKVGMTMLWVTYITVRIIDEIVIAKTANKKQCLSLCVQMCLALTLMYFSKANTSVIYLVTASALLLFFTFRKKWMPLLSVVISAVLVILIRFPIHDALNAERSLNLDAHKYYAGIHDMQATYYSGGKFSDENLNLLKKYIPNIDDIKDGFRPDGVIRGHWGNLQAVQEDMTTSEFVSMYADTFVRNPAKMLSSMLHRTRAYWVIDPKHSINWVNYTSIFDPSTRNYATQAAELEVNRDPSFLTHVMDRYSAIMIMPIPATFVWRFGFWTALMIISIATLIWKKRYVWLLAYIPVFTFLATILLTSGWTDYRYGLPVLFIGLFLPTALLLLMPTSNAGEVGT